MKSQRYSRVMSVGLQTWRSRLRHQGATLALNRRLLVFPTEVHPLCVLHQCYCFANAQPPSSHLLLTPHSFFSLTLSTIMLSLSEDQSNMEWVDGSIRLSVLPLLRGGNMSTVGPLGGYMLCCWYDALVWVYFAHMKLFSSFVTILTTVA